MSRKNKGTHGKGKAPVELEQDEFVSGVAQVAEKLKPHLKIIVGLTAVMTVAMIAFYTYQYIHERAETQATALYREALAAAQRPVVPALEDDDAAADEAVDDRLAEPFRTREAQLEAILTPLETLAAEHGSTRTARTARMFYASTLYDAGRYDDAAAAYEQIVADGTVDAELVAIAREGLGYAQEAAALAKEDQAAREAGLAQALATFGQLTSAEEGAQRQLELYHEGRLLATLGRRDEAVAAFEKALEIEPESPRRSEIRQRLALLGAAGE